MVVAGSTVCLVLGGMSLVCGLYWLICALVYNDVNLPSMLSSIVTGLYLTICGVKGRRKSCD